MVLALTSPAGRGSASAGEVQWLRYRISMRPTMASTLWLELLGGLLIVLGLLLAWAAWAIAQYSIEPGLEKNLLKLRIDLGGFTNGLARNIATAGASMAAVGAVLFFGANHLVRLFRLLLGLAALLAVGVWVWLAFR